ncbi:MAG: ABC transporter substrate-binding protein [Gordonia sp. (in: high G+C Gram-positive bacteria)]
MPSQRRRRIGAPRRAVALVLGLLGVLTTVSACGQGEQTPTITYVIDANLSTYNANTVAGNADSVLMAFTRVLPGFSLLGDAGQVIPDRDVGTVTEVPGDRQTLRYTFNPRARFSDGEPLDCDDLVLAWAANSGRFPGFRPATTAGYRDITGVDCAPGERTATVTFAPARGYRDWLGLFGAGSLLPAHVVARAAGVAGVLPALRENKRAQIATIAKAWNSGFDLRPGAVDAARFPASGPYRLEQYSAEGGLVLVANDKWWGEAPAVSRIVVIDRTSGTDRHLISGDGDVIDVTAGLAGTDPALTTSNRETAGQATGVEGLVLSGRGVFADVRMRRAFASCVPRDALARQFGQGAQLWNMRVLAPADELAAAVNGEFGTDYLRPNPDRTRRLLAEVGTARRGSRTVRIGYRAPTARWQQMVTAINRACSATGLQITDASGAYAGPTSLGDTVDAILATNGVASAAAGAADPTHDSFALRSGDPLDLPRFRSRRVDEALDELAIGSLSSDRLGLVRSIETAAWMQVPSIPLFAAPRVHHHGDQVRNVVAGMARSGTGWNMDRWSLEESGA